MAKIKVDLDKLILAFPEAEGLKFLPRKKKKALKKKIEKMLIDLLNYESQQIMAQIMEDTLFNEVCEKMEELQKEIDRFIEEKEEKC